MKSYGEIGGDNSNWLVVGAMIHAIFFSRNLQRGLKCASVWLCRIMTLLFCPRWGIPFYNLKISNQDAIPYPQP
jgi:hypothetical protein